MAKTQIYVPQTGTIYPSAAAAASALGVDASNIGKVVRGSRKSAGGYNFVAVTADVAPSTLKFINEAIETELTPSQKKRQAQRRRAGRNRLSADERAAAKARGKAAKALQGVLSETNKILDEYKRQGLDAVSGIVPELDKLKDLIGRNKRGGFNAGAKNLAQFSEKELKALTEAVTKQINRRGFKDLDEARKRKQAVAYQLGLGSSEELETYYDVLPDLWHILELARQTQGKGYDRSLYNAVSEVMQSGLDPDAIKSVLDDMIAEHEGYIADKDEAEDVHEIDYTEMVNRYADMLYDMQDEDEDGEDGDIDDITGGEWITLDT